MNTTDHAFEEACAHYEEGKTLVGEWLALAKDKIPLTYADAMRDYDYILQGILLHVALSDGYFFECEQLFIRNITEYADLLAGFKLVKGAAEKELMWSNIDDLPDDAKALCAQDLLIALGQYVDDFITLFAAVDGCNPQRDFLQEFKDNVFKIVLNLAVVDGDEEDSIAVKKEFAAGYGLFVDIVETKWLCIKTQS